MEVINYGNHGLFFDNNLETSFLCLMTHSLIKKKREICSQAGYEEVLRFSCFLTRTHRSILLWDDEFKKSLALLEEGVAGDLYITNQQTWPRVLTL